MLTKDFTGVHLKMFQKSRCAPSVLAGWDKLFNNIIERHVTVSLTLVRWLIAVNLVMSFLLLQKSFWSNWIDMSHKNMATGFPFLLTNTYVSCWLKYYQILFLPISAGCSNRIQWCHASEFEQCWQHWDAGGHWMSWNMNTVFACLTYCCVFVTHLGSW